MLLFASTLSWGMFSLGLLMLIFILIRRSRRYLQRTRREAARRPAAPPARAREPLTDAPPDLLRWQVEMHETARDLKAELDSKMGALQVLLRQADEASGRLETALLRAEQRGLVPACDPLAEIERAGERDADEAARIVAALPRLPDPQTALQPACAADRQRVYAMADAGASAGAIAANVGATVGEVEFVLSLRGAE